jgi:hypothetical protein
VFYKDAQVPNGMKGLFEGILQKMRKSYKLLLSMTEMSKISAANHMVLKILINGILPVNRT